MKHRSKSSTLSQSSTPSLTTDFNQIYLRDKIPHHLTLHMESSSENTQENIKPMKSSKTNRGYSWGLNQNCSAQYLQDFSPPSSNVA